MRIFFDFWLSERYLEEEFIKNGKCRNSMGFDSECLSEKQGMAILPFIRIKAFLTWGNVRLLTGFRLLTKCFLLMLKRNQLPHFYENVDQNTIQLFWLLYKKGLHYFAYGQEKIMDEEGYSPIFT